MTPERQEEIEEFLNLLVREYSPTHIAVEFSKGTQDQVDSVYSDYLSGSAELRRVEQHQLGYRLGKILGLTKIHAVDWNGYPPGDFDAYDWATFGRENGFEELIEARSDPSNIPNIDDMSGQSISEWLVRINDPDILAAMHRPYFEITRVFVGEQYPGANWVGSWYGRNLKIFNNILEIAEGSDSRILVIYGLGHAYLLNQFAVESGYFNVESLSNLLD